MGEPIKYAGLRQSIQNVLMSNECQSIDFSLDGIHIDGSGYSFVALALISAGRSQNNIRIAVKHMPKGVGAQYDPSTNTFEFPRPGYGTTDAEKLTIVHESTHALIDARKKRTTMINNEICAYIAGAIYNSNLKTKIIFSSGIHAEAQRIADRILANRLKFKYNQQYNLSDYGVDKLRQMIVDHSVYDYIKKDIRGSYGENGVAL